MSIELCLYRAEVFPDPLLHAARSLMERCVERNVRVVFAESCTGGLVAAAMTALPGASRVVDRGFVVYSNESKEQELGVSKALMERHGAVSEEVAIAMALGALNRARDHAQLGVAVTGVSGPEASAAKPQGLVHVAVARLSDAKVFHQKFEFGALGRDRVREQSVLAALRLASQHVEG